MRIIIIGKFSENSDEGMRNVGINIANEFEKRHTILRLPIKNFSKYTFWVELKNFCSDVVYITFGPSLRIFILMKIISFVCPKSLTIIHATHPYHSKLLNLFAPLLSPDLVIVNSLSNKNLFSKLKFKTILLPLGVDIYKFHPIKTRDKLQIRSKYMIDSNVFVVLHVGHLKYGRNIQILEHLQSAQNQVIIIGSSSTDADNDLLTQLSQAGCIIFKKFIDKIEEVYQMADCYIFPTKASEIIENNSDTHAIDIPLSVLEAMACNLPIISSRYRGLPDFFKNGNGFYYFDNYNEIEPIIKSLKMNKTIIKTRENIKSYSWENISKSIELEIGVLKDENG